MMKIKPLLIGLGLGITILSGCSDDLNLVGSTIQPGGDKMPVYVDTFQMQATTLLMDSVYARTTSGLLGEFYDPLYGNVKSDYICQFYCPSDFKFQKNLSTDRSIRSILRSYIIADHGLETR